MFAAPTNPDNFIIHVLVVMVFGLFRSDPPVAIPNRSLWKNLFDAEYESTSEKTRPKITLFLNATNIGTVDGADQSTLSVRTRRGHRSWKLRYFKYLFVVSAHNCWEVVSASPRQQHHLQGPSVFLLIWGLMAKTEEEGFRIAIAVSTTRPPTRRSASTATRVVLLTSVLAQNDITILTA